MAEVFFYILGAIAIAAGIMVVTRRNAVHAAIYLVTVMCAIAGLFVQLGSYFIAALQIIVYAGAIMVLFLFVIMMLNLKRDEFGFDSRIFQRVFGFVLAILLMIQLVMVTTRFPSGQGRPVDTAMGSAASLARKLFYDYLYPFEIVGVLLLAAIMGAFVLARRTGEE